ncbi:major facilitator superfamily domain-containing protein [Aspergillus cavernicola]|uniref:Major facilitator superfamily domain-containing protein n=1 Tax=Aspergillus cavernicola TaxID=176166 RepID=A0ABR4HBS2_9EURO
MAALKSDYLPPHDAEAQEPPFQPPSTDEKGPDDTFGPAPDGGPRAWLVAIGTCCTIFSTLGFANSFGVLQEYYAVHQLQGQSADRIAWIGSLTAFLQFATGAVAGPLFDRYGALVIRPAAILYIFALMMTSLCSEYWQFMLAQGVLVGLSTGFLQSPSMAAVSQWFDKKRAAALGLAVAGSSIGGVVFPIALSNMLNGSSLSFGWSIRIVAFMMVPTMAISCLTVRARLPPRTTAFFIGAAFKQTRYVLIIAAMFFMILGMFTPLFFIPSYAVSRGMDATLASYLIAITNGASTFGRIIPGILADKFGRLNAFGIGGIATGIVVCCMNKAESTAALVVYSVVFGFCSGTIISGGSAAITQCPRNPQEFGTYLGMGIALVGCAALIGPPVSGALVDRYGEFLELSIFSGVMCLVGGFIALFSKTTTDEGLFGRV